MGQDHLGPSRAVGNRAKRSLPCALTTNSTLLDVGRERCITGGIFKGETRAAWVVCSSVDMLNVML